MESRQELVAQSIKDCVAILQTASFQRPALAPLRAKLEKVANELQDLHLVQHSSRTSAGDRGKQIARLREDLRKRLLRISKLAAATLEGLPGIDDDVRVPHANATNEELQEATSRIIKNVSPHLTTLYETGLAQDFISGVETVAETLAAKAASPNVAMARRSRATRSIPSTLQSGRKIIGALHTIIVLELADDQPAMHVWKTAKKIPRKIGRPKARRRGKRSPGDANSESSE